ncbi:L-cystine transport system permease protein TcyB [compost metagenome]
MNRTLPLSWITGLLALLMLLVPGCSRTEVHSADALERVRQAGELVMGTDATYPPFENKVGSDLVGFDIELGEAVAQKLGVKPRWVNSSFDGIFPALLSRKFDMVISASTITPERQKTLAFSDPYYDAGQVITLRSDQKPLTLDDLTGKTVGVQINTTGHVMLEARSGVRLKKFNSIDLAFLDLQNGRLDAVVNDAPTTRYMLKQSFPSLVVSGEPFTSEHYGMAFHPEDGALVKAVNQALAEIRASGEYDRLYSRWFAMSQVEGAKPVAPKLFDPSLFKDLWQYLLNGMVWTVQLTAWGLVCGLPVGLLIGLFRVSPIRALSLASMVYVEAIRGTPLLVQIFTIYFVLPAFGIKIPEYLAAILALSINSSAYIAEIFRAGIESIPKGQMEAARSLGFGYIPAMALVILPQAMRRVVPPLTNEAISLLKDSSLVSLMGMTELTRTGQELASRLANPMTVWLAVALCYLLLTIPLTSIARMLEKRWTY